MCVRSLTSFEVETLRHSQTASINRLPLRIRCWCVTTRIHIRLRLDSLHWSDAGGNSRTCRVVVGSHCSQKLVARVRLLLGPRGSIRLRGTRDRVDDEHVAVATPTPKGDRSDWGNHAYPHRYRRSDRSMEVIRSVASDSCSRVHQVSLAVAHDQWAHYGKMGYD